MTAPPVEIALDQRALDHIRRMLEEGRTLGSLLLKRDDLPAGKVVTYLPPGVSPSDEELYRFDDGILPQPDPSPSGWALVRTMSDHLETLLVEFLQADPLHICLFSDPFATSSAPWLANEDRGIALFGEQVYYLLASGDVFTRDVPQFVLWPAGSPWWNGALTSVQRTADIPPHKGRISDDLMHALVQRTQKILVDAYDFESFLLWSKS